MGEIAEQMQGAQKVAWADNAIKLAVDMTVAGINRLNLQGNAEQQAAEVRKAMRVLFPEAVTLVREAREGFGANWPAQRSARTAVELRARPRRRLHPLSRQPPDISR